jgi:thiol-disulfide isomerase/thioredoxin
MGFGWAQDTIRIDGPDQQILQGVLRNRPAMVYVWATWCGPCREELPRIKQFMAGHKLRIIGLHLGGDWQGIGAYLQRENLTGLETYRISTTEARKLKLPGVPTSFVFDAKGKIVKTHYGPLTWETLLSLSRLR